MECIRCGCKLGLGDNQERCLCHTCELVEMVKDRDHRIAVLEKENESLKKDVMDWADGSIIVNFKKELKEIRHKAHILERALELACYDSDNWFEEQEALNNKMSLKEHFIKQAEKEVEEKK